MKIAINIFRFLFSLLDSAIYGLIERAFLLILDLANLEIFSATTIADFSRRIYIILGLVMVFKLMISFIQIIINPEKMEDKEQGVGNVLKRVVIALVLIVMVPSIFDLARQAQEYIIPVIPRVMMGININPDINNPDTRNKIDTTARKMAFYSFLPFFNYDNVSCDDGTIYGTGSAQSGIDNNVEIYSVGTAHDHINDTDKCSNDKHEYKYSYQILMSTLVGGYELFVLVQIAVEIAIRAIKLSICEFVAPIPIASYIDPKSSKKTFDKWVSVTLKTYADLFIRLLILYFVIFVFMTIWNDNTYATMTANLGGDFWRISFVMLFIIIALLQFVKQAPKFLSDLLGLGTEGNLMGMFKGEGYKEMSKSIGGFAGMAGAGIGSAVTNFRYARKQGERGMALGRAVGGFFGGTARATTAAFKGEGLEGALFGARNATVTKSKGNVDRSRRRAQARDDYNDRRKKGENPIRPTNYGWGRVQAGVNNFFGKPMPNSKTYSEAAKYMAAGAKISSDLQDKVESAPTLIQDNIKFKNKSGTLQLGEGKFQDIYNALHEAQANGTGRAKIQIGFDKKNNVAIYATANDGRNEFSISELQEIYNEAKSDAGVILGNKIGSGEIKDDKISSQMATLRDNLEKDLVLSDSDYKEVMDKYNGGAEMGSFLKETKGLAGRFERTSTELKRYEPSDSKN